MAMASSTLVHDVADAELQRRVLVMRAAVPPDLAAVGDAARAHQRAHQVVPVGRRAADLGRARAGEVLEDGRAVALEPGLAPQPEGAAGAERQDVGQHVAHHVHGVDDKGAVFDADVDVHPEDEQPLRQELHLLQHAPVAGQRRHRLVLPAAEGVGRGRHHGQILLRGQVDDEAALLDQLLVGLLQVVADRRAQFHHRLVQFGLEVAFHHHHMVAFDELGDERAQLPRLPGR